MKLARALGYLDLSKSSYCYQSRPRSEDKRVFPLDPELEKALKAMTGYELTLGYDKEVVGFQMDIHCGAQQAIEALRQALSSDSAGNRHTAWN